MQIIMEQWTDFIKILREFGNWEEIDNQDYLWEIVINIRKNMHENLKQSIRINSQLCYLLEEEDLLKDINSPLFRLNHIFEHNFYRIDNDSFQGLKNFHKMLEATYGNMERFIQELRRVKENLSFIRKRYDRVLIERYKYFKQISLPPRGYEDLRKDYSSILGKFKLLKTLLTDPKAYNVFMEEVDNFKKRYITRYKEEHQYFQQELDSFYHELHSLPEYRALENLSKIRMVKVAYNLKPIKKYIDTFFPEKCRVNNLDEVLDSEIKCSCGFNLGDILTIPSLKKIKPMLRKGIIEYIEQLQNKRFKALFMNYLSYNNESSISQLLEVNPEKLNGFLEYIDERLIREINEALSNTYPLKISFDELASAVAGTYPISQLDLLSKKLTRLIEEKTAGMEEIGFDEIAINLIK